MEINYWAILVCAILTMVLGSIWYGPLFGKKWMEITGANAHDLETRKKMQKEAGPLYLVQFILSLFQIWVLAYYVSGWEDASGLVNALWIWAAFVMPTIAACSMWTADKGKVKWARFFIQSGHFLVTFIMYGLILGLWR